jgi:Transglycosylase-like domain
MRPIFNGRKTRLVYAGTGAVALAIPATAAALTVGPLSTSTGGGNAARSSDVSAVAAAQASPPALPARKPPARTAAQRGCAQVFTVNMGEGAANLIYSRTNAVTLHDLQVLGYIERCQRNPAAQGFVRDYDQHQAHLHAARIAATEAAAAAQAAQSQQPQLSAQSQRQSSESQTQPQQAASDVSSGGPRGCIIQHESGGNPQATNGQYEGLGQWSPAAWAEDGGTQYAPSPLGASAAEQEAVLNSEGAAGMQQQQGQYDGC